MHITIMSAQVCRKCGAFFFNGEHRWAYSGKKGNPLDLAGLVCNKYADEQCINPCRGMKGGDTWEARQRDMPTALTYEENQ